MVCEGVCNFSIVSCSSIMVFSDLVNCPITSSCSTFFVVITINGALISWPSACINNICSLRCELLLELHNLPISLENFFLLPLHRTRGQHRSQALVFPSQYINLFSCFIRSLRAFTNSLSFLFLVFTGELITSPCSVLVLGNASSSVTASVGMMTTCDVWNTGMLTTSLQT